jgi:enoyl-CoA hydratase/carnithine racemase
MMTEKNNATLKQPMIFIKKEQKGFVRIITIDRPDVSNFLNYRYILGESLSWL